MRLGEVIDGRFQLERHAGSGGMGTVYRAIDLATGDVVALKLLGRPEPAAVARFEHEARILAELNHPRIVRHVAHGIAIGSEPYLAMEWLEGESLAERLARGDLAVEESLALLRAAAEALGAAHVRGIVHRDVKPSNLLLVGGDAAGLKVLDFGIARMKRTFGSFTQTGSVLGTPGYMAPEQATGDRERLDARADVFSLGAVIFECLAGRPAFQGPHLMALLAQLLIEEAPRVRRVRSELPVELDDLVARMLSKDPARRPRDGAAVVAALDALERGVKSGSSFVPALKEAITGSELRLLSVVAAEKASHGPAGRGSTTLAVSTPRDLLPQLHALAQQIGARMAELADGTLLFSLAGLGDALEQAARAAQCALGLRKFLPDSRVIVATGLGEQTSRIPVGPVMEQVAALLGAAPGAPPPDGAAAPVRIDEVTRALLEGRFDLDLSGAGDLSGLRERDLGGGARTLLGKPSPHVGRDREIRNLREILDDCFEGPEARAILITGPPGIGKSRLRHELLEDLRRQRPDMIVAVGRGDAMSAGSPFSLLGSALRGAAGITGGEPAAVQREKLLSLVACVRPEERARIAAFLGEIVGTPFPSDVDPKFHAARESPTLMADQIPLAFLIFVAAECEARPHLLVLEDVHWGDAASLKLVDRVLRELRDMPFAVLCLARLDVHEAFPKLWEGSQVQEMKLGALPRRASEDLVRRMLGDVISARELSRIVERAGGNAFYLEELIRAVAEGRGDRLPESLLGMVEERLAALPADARRLLRAASVFGTTFWAKGALALLGDVDGTTLMADWLPWLLERELVVRRDHSRFADQVEYAFRHALIRDGCYAMMTDRDRALGHNLAAEWLLQAGEHDAKVLAEHFERGGEERIAVELYLRAAEQALAGRDWTAAMTLSERGLALGAERDTAAALRAIRESAADAPDSEEPSSR